MSRYLFIQSQDPFTEVRTNAQYDLAKSLASSGNSVQLLLVQNGVLAARQGASSEAFDSLASQGVKVLADTFPLKQPEIETNQLKPFVAPAENDMEVPAMIQGNTEKRCV